MTERPSHAETDSDFVEDATVDEMHTDATPFPTEKPPED